MLLLIFILIFILIFYIIFPRKKKPQKLLNIQSSSSLCKSDIILSSRRLKQKKQALDLCVSDTARIKSMLYNALMKNALILGSFKDLARIDNEDWIFNNFCGFFLRGKIIIKIIIKIRIKISNNN